MGYGHHTYEYDILIIIDFVKPYVETVVYVLRLVAWRGENGSVRGVSQHIMSSQRRDDVGNTL